MLYALRLNRLYIQVIKEEKVNIVGGEEILPTNLFATELYNLSLKSDCLNQIILFSKIDDLKYPY